ncbi:MAG TPA: fatty acid CoA ligase family protein [Pirellulaceae bacterium]|nr:fatty acid CoA ligase family protein [Pirellulaceae bacterium]
MQQSAPAETRLPTPDPRHPAIVNVGLRLSETARLNPNGVAVVVPRGRDGGKRIYASLTFRELDDDSNLLADGLAAMGARPGTRLVLMVPPSIDFISLVFAMFKAGVVSVLIDPGMGRRNLIRCLVESEPEGFIGVPLAQAVRCVLRGRFPNAKLNVTVGRRWFWGGRTIAQLRARKLSADWRPAVTKADDPAAIIFTTGSTGPPKGTLYRHGNFDRQADEIRDFYRIQPGEIDLPGFPLFALFNCAMGVTTVIPDMDPTRPARVDPRNIVEAVTDWKVTQAFGSPALWNVVGRYCEERQIVMPTLRRVMSAGAPVPPHVLQRMKAAIAPEGDVHTPYGATEALPVASIAASEVLAETAAKSAAGAGTCVGRHFPGIDWKVIRITDGPLATLERAEELPSGEIGELIVRGPVVTTEYVTRTECNALHKIRDGQSFWHRMGDVGYLEHERFWFCGRKSHRVITPRGTLFTIPCEAIFNQHPRVYRSALVGVGGPGQQRPVIIVEPWPEKRPRSTSDAAQLIGELRELGQQHAHTAEIGDFMIRNALPVDIRHNAKIFREQLAIWAAWQLGTTAQA